MFKQLLTPVGGSLALSFIVAIVPIVVVLIGLGVMRRPAWQASLAGLIVAFRHRRRPLAYAGRTSRSMPWSTAWCSRSGR